jgi:hypothetical protein
MSCLAFYFLPFWRLAMWIGVEWIGLDAAPCRILPGQQRLAGAEGGSSRLVLWRGRFVSFLCLCLCLGSCCWVLVGTACVCAPQPRLVKGCLASALSVAVAVVLVIAVAMPLPLTLTLTSTQAASHRININHHQLGS